MNSEGKINKRKFPFNGKNNNKKFQQNKKKSGQMPRESFRWSRPQQSESSNYFHHQNYNWVPPKNNLNPFQNSSFNTGFHQQFFNCSNPMRTETPNEPEEVISVGPGSELDRMEKVLAAKRRIEEALATKSSDVNNTEITLQDSSSPKECSKDKETDKNLPVTNLDSDRIDLRLTNSDFKEIGSVASSVVVEGENEGSDLILNVACSSQQRSFDNAALPSITIPKVSDSNVNKSQRIGGWNMSALNEIVTTEQVHLSPKDRGSSNSIRSRGEMFIQESREKILGNVEPVLESQNPVSKTFSPKQSQRSGFERVGRLYQSFLKSRLCGYTLKMREKQTKCVGPNPLLDKSVLENQMPKDNQGVLQDNQIIELEMPRPILVKTDNSQLNNVDQTPEDVAAVEAQEFCQEFSYLLTHPNFLIPPENLEKLGLGHLSEMNKLINERRSVSDPPEDVSSNQDSFLRVRSLNALNSITENDIVFNQRAVNSSPPVSNFINPEPSLSTANTNCMIPPNIPQNSSITGQNISVDIVAEKVIEKLSSSDSASSHTVNANILSMLKTIISQSNHNAGISDGSSQLPSAPPSNEQCGDQLRNISSKILRLFLIDKQIEELMLEKMKIYNELLSMREVSSTLFNSWAKDQIVHGNVMNVISNTASIVPELTRILQNQVKDMNQGDFSSSHLDTNSSRNNTFEEILSAVRNECRMDSSETNFQSMPFEPCIPGKSEPPDPVFSVPIDSSSEINKPKLSVRKDLIDPNLNRNLIISDFIPPNEATDSNSIKTKKKKLKTKIQGASSVKKKKKQVFEFVNLIEDTTDEETSGVSGFGSLSALDSNLDGLPHENIAREHHVKRKKIAMVYDLQDTTATRLTILKKALIVGCKDGSVKVFSMVSGKEDLHSQVHSDAIMCIHALSKHIITGSADSTISVFSLESKSKIQILDVIAPLQCCDVQFCKAYFGTKTGFLVVYKVQMVGGQMSLEQDHQPLKLTNCSILAVRVAEEGTQRVVILASRGEQVTVREATTGKVLRTFDWCDTVHCIELYNSSPLVYCGTNTKSVKVMNFTTGENMSDCHLSRAIVQIAFLGSIMFAASFDGQVYVYDVEDKKRICIMQAAKGLIQSMTVHKLKIFVACNQNELKALSFPKELKRYLKEKQSNYCVGSDMTSQLS